MTTPPLVSVTLPADAWNVVGAGLGKLLHEVAAPVFDEIRRQVREAVAPQIPPAPPSTTEPVAEPPVPEVVLEGHAP